MKVLTKGIYYVNEDSNIRIWHDCSEYKKRPLTRVEMIKTEENEDSIIFTCRYCDFVYLLDKHLNLK